MIELLPVVTVIQRNRSDVINQQGWGRQRGELLRHLGLYQVQYQDGMHAWLPLLHWHQPAAVQSADHFRIGVAGAGTNTAGPSRFPKRYAYRSCIRATIFHWIKRWDLCDNLSIAEPLHNG